MLHSLSRKFAISPHSWAQGLCGAKLYEKVVACTPTATQATRSPEVQRIDISKHVSLLSECCVAEAASDRTLQHISTEFGAQRLAAHETHNMIRLVKPLNMSA